MTNFTVEKKVEGDVYTITYTKVVKDINGKDVTILDRIEDVTLKQLEERKQGVMENISQLQGQVTEIDAKVVAIKALG